MTVDFDTAGAGIFKRLGKVFGVVKRVTAFQSDLRTNASQSLQEAINEYITSAGSTANTDLQYVSQFSNNLENIVSDAGTPVLHRAKRVAETTLVEMMSDDLAGETPPSGLPAKTVNEALYELRDQMIANSKTLDGSTVTIASTAAGGSNTGTGTVVVSAEPDNDKHATMSAWPTSRTETLRFKCYQDSRDRKIAKGAEFFEVRGAQKFSAMDHRWPGGSGFVGRYQSVNPSESDGRRVGRNILRNSSFESFIDNGDAPANWEIVTGSASSNIFQETSNVARGTKALRLQADGSTLLKIRQKLGDPQSGSLYSVRPDGLYCLSFMVRYANTNPSAGVLRVGLANSSGTFATFDAADHTMTTSYVLFTHTFRAPLDLADPIYLQIQTSTAFTSGAHILIDAIQLSEMTPTAKAGVAFTIIPGETDFVRGDEFTVDVTNNGEGEFIHYFDRFFDMHGNGIVPPINILGGENIDDALVT